MQELTSIYGFVAFKGHVPPRKLKVLMRKIEISTELNEKCVVQSWNLPSFQVPKAERKAEDRTGYPEGVDFFDEPLDRMGMLDG